MWDIGQAFAIQRTLKSVRCASCGKVPLKFSKSRPTLCVECWNAKCREYYWAKGKAKNNERSRIARKNYVAENRAWIHEYLRAHPCVDCGESDLVVLEFDHVRGVKCGNVGELITRGRSPRKLREEVAKCEVVCANCHRRRTAKRAGNWTKVTNT